MQMGNHRAAVEMINERIRNMELMWLRTLRARNGITGERIGLREIKIRSEIRGIRQEFRRQQLKRIKRSLVRIKSFKDFLDFFFDF